MYKKYVKKILVREKTVLLNIYLYLSLLFQATEEKEIPIQKKIIVQLEDPQRFLTKLDIVQERILHTRSF